MKVKAVGNKMRLLIEPIKVGAIETDTIPERAVVVDVGDACAQQWLGKVIYFKAWAVDCISTPEGEKMYFIAEDSTAICGYEGSE